MKAPLKIDFRKLRKEMVEKAIFAQGRAQRGATTKD
jgi:hypothetical protein